MKAAGAAIAGVPAAAPVSRNLHVRSICDEYSHAWTVSERAVPYADPRGTGSLIFDSDYSVRRVRNFPTNWFELSDAELCVISRQR
jgi:hypothetical protein